MKKRLFAVLLMMSFFVGSLAGCGQKPVPVSGNGSSEADVEEKKIKDHVIAALNAEPVGLDPQQTYQITAFIIQEQVFDTLVSVDGEGNPLPCLAKEWERLDDNTVRFHLRDDVYFHNGEKMTAEDVRFTIWRATTMANSANMFSSFDGEKTAVVDEYTVDVVTKTPFAALYTYLSMPRAQIVCKKAIEEMGDNEANRNPIGTGAFRFSKWETGTGIELVRNEEYWGEKPAYTNLTFRIVAEAASRAIEIETGNVDIAFSPDASDVMRLEGSSDVVTVISPSYGGMTLYMNASENDPVLSDSRVRKAMAHALDTEAITETVYGPLGTASRGVCPMSFSSGIELNLYEYNPDRARELLAEAGYGEGEAEINLFVYNGSDAVAVSEICQNMWTQVGFKVNITQGEMGAILPQVRDYEGSGWCCSWSWGADDGGLFIGDFDPANTSNSSYAFDERITELRNSAASCLDPEERNKLYAEAQRILYEENVSAITISDKNLAYFTTPDVTNFYGSSTGAPYLGNVVVYE